MTYFYVYDKRYVDANKKEVHNFSNRNYQSIDLEDKKVLIYNAVGVSKEDLKVENTRENGVDYISIKGTTKNEYLDDEMTINARFHVEFEKIKSIDYYLKDGLLYIISYLKEEEKPNIKIKYKD